MSDTKTIIKAVASDLRLERQILLKRLVDDSEGLSLFLEETTGQCRKLVLLFSDVYGYRNFDEGDLIEYWNDLGGYPEHVCYQILKSKFLDWAKHQSPYKEYPEGIKHYSVSTSNDVVDILCYEEPKVTILSENA